MTKSLQCVYNNHTINILTQYYIEKYDGEKGKREKKKKETTTNLQS
jgi:hypothetical protein